MEKGKSGLIVMGDLPRGKNGLIIMGDLPRLKKMKNGLIVWVTFPEKEWSHCMGDLPKKNNGLIVWVTYPR